MLFSVRARSGATTIPFPRETWKRILSSLDTLHIAWKKDIIKTNEGKDVLASTQFTYEGQIEFKQFYSPIYSGSNLKQAIQPYLSPLLNYSNSVTLYIGIEDKNRRVIGVPIYLKEKGEFENELKDYFLGSIFPPLPSNSISISW